MGDENKTQLIRPDGTEINVPTADVDQYRALGYREQDAQGAYNSAIEQAKEEHFTSFGQRAATVGEGLLSGATLGLSTLARDDEDEGDRARYNPGLRLGAELVGGLVPTIVAPESLLAKTPAGLAARGAGALAEATTGTRIGHAVVRGAVEGAALGASAEAVTTHLDGSPLTAEAVVAGLGWGALFGGVLSGAVEKFGIHAEAAAAERAAAGKSELIPAERWSAFRGSVDEIRKVADTAVKQAAEHAATETADDLVSRVLSHAEEAEAAQKHLFAQIDAKGGWASEGARGLRGEVMGLRRQAVAAASSENGNYARFTELMGQHQDAMRVLAAKTGVVAPELAPFVMNAAKTSRAAMQELQGLKAVASTLEKFPVTADGFIAMTPGKFEKQVAAVDKFLKGGSAEMEGAREAVKKTIADMAQGAGLQFTDQSPVAQLRGIYETTRAAAKEGKAVAAGRGNFITSAAKYAGGKEASHFATREGAGVFGKSVAYGVGSRVVGGLLDLKGKVLGTLSNSVATWGPGAAKAAGKVTSRIDPLRTRLDGTPDQSSKSRKELIEARSREIREAAPAIRDKMYKAIEPLAANHPDLAVAMNRAAVASFDALASRLPRDPGTAFARMRSLWSPDFIQTEKFAREYEVFQNPVGVAVRWLSNPKTVTPEGARMLKESNPELWTHLRVEMLDRLSDPAVMNRLKYSEQVALGQMLDITVHSTQDPRFIKAQQEMFSERNQPLPTRPSAGGNNSNNPSGVSRGMTAAQRITDH